MGAEDLAPGLRQRHRGARIDEASVKALVAGAIPEMRAEDVSVVQTPAPAPARAEARLVMVGPIGVSRGSAAALKAILAAALGLNVVLVLALLWRARFASRKTTKTAAARDGAAEE
ncbi:MAG: hypothetical protein K8H88_07545 [Sandaracinaceae bacterium]|nr:hypothetical protein [Sandaracinaceae bacterium]